MKKQSKINIFTDGSYDAHHKTGAWAGIIVSGDEEKTLTGSDEKQSQHVMELKAVIRCIEYAIRNYENVSKIQIYTDSSYVKNLIPRREKLQNAGFKTKKGVHIANRPWVEYFYNLIKNQPIEIEKICSHQKKGVSEATDYNRKVDQLARRLLKRKIKGLD